MNEAPPSSSLPPETTEVLYGNENTQTKVVEAYLWIKETLDGCIDHSEVAMHVEYDAIYNFHVQLKKEGVRLWRLLKKKCMPPYPT